MDVNTSPGKPRGHLVGENLLYSALAHEIVSVPRGPSPNLVLLVALGLVWSPQE